MASFDAAVKSSRLEGAGVSRNSRYPGKVSASGHCSTVGVPKAANIFPSWSISVSPAKYGVRSISSAKMQPIYPNKIALAFLCSK
jgi:hypothetical protein